MIHAESSLWIETGHEPQFRPHVTMVLRDSTQVIFLDLERVAQRTMDCRYLCDVCNEAFVEAVKGGFPETHSRLYIRTFLYAIKMHPDLRLCVKV